MTIKEKLQAILSDPDNVIQPYHEVAIRDAISKIDELLDLLDDALPHVLEGEEFNKPTRRGLSKHIQAEILAEK